MRNHGPRPRGPAVLALVSLSSLVLAGILAPVVIGLGLIGQSAADQFEHLPARLPQVVLAQRSVLLDSTGKALAVMHGPEDRTVVSLGAVAPVVQQAIVAVEDARFYLHHGVDFRALLRAAVHNSRGGNEQGASTLTEQYVKLALLEGALTPAQRAAVTSRTSYQRKLREARLALALEHRETKQQILTDYLNIAYFGEGAYGIATASHHYFGIPPSRLTLPEAALLAGMVNSPSLFDPERHPQAAIARRTIVLTRMLNEHMITRTQWRAADTARLGVKRQPSKTVVDACEASTAPFYCDWVRAQLRADERLGSTQALRDRSLFTGGLTIRTTLDPVVQAAAQRAVDATVPRSDHATAIIVIVEPGTGKVLAMAANRSYAPGPGPEHTRLGYLGYRPIFQGGSTFKVFTLVTALQQGLPLSTSFYAPRCLKPDPTLWDVPTVKVGSNCPGGYQNSDPAEAATYDAVAGTWKSVNTYYIQLEERLGILPIIATAESLGIRRAAFASLSPRSLSLTLGAVDGVSPLEEASAYAALAAHGKYCDPYGVVTIARPGTTRQDLVNSQSCRQALEPQIADTVTGVLRGVLEQHGATAFGKGLPGRDAAGKTGTLNNEAAAWFVGFTTQLAGAVVIGDPNGPSRPLGVVQGVSPVYGGTLPALIWQRAMTEASGALPLIALPDAIGVTRPTQAPTFITPTTPSPHAPSPAPTPVPTPITTRGTTPPPSPGRTPGGSGSASPGFRTRPPRPATARALRRPSSRNRG
ncbi:MAG: glycosyl transferase family 51 [Frankiales bacterium]|nr:glycosyl transferase family 51 [Frankiales bacterium]